MADSVPVVPGNETSEYAFSRAVVILAGITSVLGTILSVLGAVTAVVPPAAEGIGLWLAIGGAAVAGLKAVAYEVQRATIKIAAIKAGQAVPVDPASVAAAAASLGAAK